MELSEDEPPGSLFKYRSIPKTPDEQERLRKLIVEGALYHAKQEQLNDPFDCIPVWVHDAGKNVLRDWADQQVTERGFAKHKRSEERDKLLNRASQPGYWDRLWRKMVQNFGVFSASAAWDVALMWAHYADNFRGICVELALKQNYQNTSNIHHLPIKVTYSRNRVGLSVRAMLKRQQQGEVSLQQAAQAFASKSSDWDYEAEWRLIRSFRNDLDGRTTHFGAHVVRSVILGPLITPEDEELIRGWVEGVDEAVRARVRKSRLHETEYRVVVDE
ncbi:MAG: DUF2971 domain-containing protein [Planctomycetaceae bacterium]|nr:DUF2971 domain-containing protein [Planctomycetaceae bacterium]